jgi:transglutaminase-like putative cysteine protease
MDKYLISHEILTASLRHTAPLTDVRAFSSTQRLLRKPGVRHKWSMPQYALDLTLRLGCECVYRASALTPALVMFKPRQSETQLIREERVHFEPGLLPSEFEDDHHNVVYRLLLQPGNNLLRYDAIVRVPSVREDAYWEDGLRLPYDLPTGVLHYTLPSRYADSDKLLDFAWQNFGHIPNGLPRVRAICAWVNENIEYRTGSGDPTLSASDVIARRYGVCRDLAHAGVALCRTFNMPARYVTGYIPDIGVIDPGTPGDFHAYFEVYLADRWQTFDARSANARIGRVKIASGHDAVNCAFTTVYGNATLERFEVWTYQVDPRDASTALPVDLGQRLDGTVAIHFSRATVR